MRTEAGIESVEVDVVVVGAGFAGLYLVHRLRQLGFRVRCFDTADDVGGTWYWNRYPGARCDIPTTDYAYSFDPELERAWTWSEKYATQPEILAYLGFVADRYDLRRDITFATRVEAAAWDSDLARWRLTTDGGEQLQCRFLVMASGCLSVPKAPEIPGIEDFAGSTYFTGTWPHKGVDFAGQRVAVIGTGSSGVQVIPLIAQQAAELVVLQRTASFVVPAYNGPPPADRVAQLAADRDAYRAEAKRSNGGLPQKASDLRGAAASPELRRERFDAALAKGELFAIQTVFSDQISNLASSEIVADLLRETIRTAVHDVETAERLVPRGYPFGTKRPCLGTGYYDAFNLPHVEVVDLRTNPILEITAAGIRTRDEQFDVDALVLATGFDAITGPLLAVDIMGRDGISMKQKWAQAPTSYLGLTISGFPNLFMVTGPGSPSVLSNMVVSIEQHVDWIADCLASLRQQGFEVIEATEGAETGWERHVADVAALTLYPTADSWYTGANIEGKPRVFYPYVGGVGAYRGVCEEVVARGFLGFRLSGPAGEQCNDGVVRRLQPDVKGMLDLLAKLDLPRTESQTVAEARASAAASRPTRPPGPGVGEVRDDVLPGPAGPLDYRLYRPDTAGPHPVLVYFHGGGWVLGDLESDDPLCRDLCVRTDAIIVSVDYRHAPEHLWPAGADDAEAAVAWVAANAEGLGGSRGALGVAGWSAGANLAAVVCQRARDLGGPQLAAQMLLAPLVDSDLSRPSYNENGEGFVLTTSLVEWFWGHYADLADRKDPRASPLRGQLHDLPAAVVVTAELDPLRDEGVAYAEALRDAGVEVVHLMARGHTHVSLTMVDVIVSGAAVRAELATHVRRLLAGAP